MSISPTTLKLPGFGYATMLLGVAAVTTGGGTVALLPLADSTRQGLMLAACVLLVVWMTFCVAVSMKRWDMLAYEIADLYEVELHADAFAVDPAPVSGYRGIGWSVDTGRGRLVVTHVDVDDPRRGGALPKRGTVLDVALEEA